MLAPNARRCSLLVLTLGMVACGAISKVTGKTQHEEQVSKQVAKLRLLQLGLMRYADDYVTEVLAATAKLEPVTAQERLMVTSFSLNQASAAFDIASGPNPVASFADMVVLVTLTRSTCQDHWVGGAFGARAQPLLDALRGLEERAWASVPQMITAEQSQAIRDGIARWQANHPDVQDVSFIRLSHLASVAGSQQLDLNKADGDGLLGTLGLDPMAGLDPAVRQVEETRILAERAFFVAKRAPRLLDLQAQQLLLQVEQQPRSQEAFQIAERVSSSMEVFARTAGDLPGLVDREREAAIRQVLDALQARERQTRALLAEARTTLEAGRSTAVSVDATIRSFDGLLARLQQPPQPPPPPGTPPSKPFDVDDYTRALRQLEESSRELQTLLATVGRDSSSIDALVQRASEESRGVVDHAFHRALALVLVLVASVLAAAIAYRSVTARIQGRGGRRAEAS